MRVWTRALCWALPAVLAAGIAVGVWWAHRVSTARAALDRYQSAAAERGVRFSLRDFAAPNLTAEANYAALPLFYPEAQNAAGAPLSFKLPPGSTLSGKVQINEILSAAAESMTKAGWIPPRVGEEDPAQAVLQGLERFSAEFAELRAARTRPGASFRRDAAVPPLAQFPHLTVCTNLAKLWALRMQAHLDTGSSAEALEDLRDGVRLYSALEREPTLITALVKVAIASQLQRAVQSGLVVHHWPYEILPEVADELRKVDLAEDVRFALESERGFINDASEWIRGQGHGDRVRRTEEIDVFDLEPRGWRLWLRAANRAADYRDQLASNQAMDRWLVKIKDGLDGLPSDESAPETLGETPPIQLEMIINKFVERAVVVEGAIRMTRIVCALEQYRAKHRTYAATLEELTPIFLRTVPKDVIDAAPMRYRRGEGSGFLLYSIGGNRKDDGGSLGPEKALGGRPRPADWVWGELWQ